MTHIVGILQARTGSSRFPGKVLKQLLHKPMILHQIERLNACTKLNELIVAITDLPEDNQLEEVLKQNNIRYFRGSSNDVLDRVYHAAKESGATDIVRLTADCPLTDPELIDDLIIFYQKNEYDYASNTLVPTFPDGLDAEVLRFKALETAWQHAETPSEREHVTPYIKLRPAEFKIGSYTSKEDLSSLRWTVDQPEDFKLVSIIYDALYKKNSKFGTTEILEFLTEHPELSSINGSILRDEGYKKSRFFERYKKSTLYLHEAEKIIPLGSQTFSKSKTQYPIGVSPLCVDRAEGARIWDIDGNEYLDLSSSLGAISLGYTAPDVIAAVTQQLSKGTIFPLPHHLELTVAEQLVDLIPCAEMVRFGKNGSDATTGAIRVARAYTGKDEVIAIGYHGWHDWYIGTTTKNRGVPKSTSELTHRLTYNDLNAVTELISERGHLIGALIMEAMNREYPNPGYLETVQELCKKNNIVFILDEMITGFRFSKGGAQELFGITPDLATFGKGIANGYPLSALVGKKELMSLLDTLFFSFTFGGEALSLAATHAVLNKIQQEPVIETIYERGKQLQGGITQAIQHSGLTDMVGVTGHPSWVLVEFKDTPAATQWEAKTLFLQQILASGILTIGSNMTNFAHTKEDIDYAILKHQEVFSLFADEIKNGNLLRNLFTSPLQPLFKVR